MTREQAAKLLGIRFDSSAAEIRRRYQELYSDFQLRLTNAPTPSLKKLFEKNLKEVKEAYQLLNDAEATESYLDFPMVEPLYDAPPKSSELRRRQEQSAAKTSSLNSIQESSQKSRLALAIIIVIGLGLIGWLVFKSPSDGKLYVSSDTDCIVYIDNAALLRLGRGQPQILPVKLGEHLIRAESHDKKDRWQNTIQVKNSDQIVVNIPLQAITAQRLADERATQHERKLAEEKAVRESLQQRLASEKVENEKQEQQLAQEKAESARRERQLTEEKAEKERLQRLAEEKAKRENLERQLAEERAEKERLQRESVEREEKEKQERQLAEINAQMERLSRDMEDKDEQIDRLRREQREAEERATREQFEAERARQQRIEEASARMQATIEASQPRVVIENIWLDHNINNNGVNGMLIHLRMSTYNLRGQSLRACAFFYYLNGRVVSGILRDYTAPNGSCTVQESFVPSHDESEFSDFRIFMPYSALPRTGGTTSYVKFNMEIQSASGGFGVSDWVSFPYFRY